MNYSVDCVVYSRSIKKLISENHYSQTTPIGADYCFILKRHNDEDGVIRGVILISPFSRLQSALKYTDYLELSRLWVADSEPKNTESFFIGKVLRYLQQHSQILGLISYADTTVGHTGAVYKATNFTVKGHTRESYHYEKEGKLTHKKKIWREAQKLGISEKEHATNLGLSRVLENKKIIFEYIFKRKLRTNGLIYKIEFENGKVYIGQTLNGLEYRYNAHKNSAKNGSNMKVHAAMRTFDYRCTITEIERVPITALSQRENFWIDEYKSTDPTYGYNDGSAPGYLILRTPETVLFEAFRLRQQGLKYSEISQRLGLHKDMINAVIWGRMRPEIRMKWLEENQDLEKQKELPDDKVFDLFKLYDQGLTASEIARRLEVTKTYVSLVLKGKMRPELKERYERKTGHQVVYSHKKNVNLELAQTVLKERYESGKTNIEIGKELGLSPTQVSTIVNGQTAKEVSSEYIKGKKLPKTFIPDALFLKAFDLVFKNGQRQDEVAKTLDISKSLLSLVFNGRTRPEIKEKWEAVNGKALSLKSLAQKRTMQDSSRRESLSEKNKGKAREKPGRSRPCVCSNGIEFPTVKAAAEHYGVHSSTVTWSLTHGDSVKVKGEDVSFRYVEQEHALRPSKERAVKTSDNHYFKTITEAAEHYQVDWATLKAALEKGRALQGVTFCYALSD